MQTTAEVDLTINLQIPFIGTKKKKSQRTKSLAGADCAKIKLLFTSAFFWDQKLLQFFFFLDYIVIVVGNNAALFFQKCLCKLLKIIL